jgi:hypothetical protein
MIMGLAAHNARRERERIENEARRERERIENEAKKRIEKMNAGKQRKADQAAADRVAAAVAALDPEAPGFIKDVLDTCFAYAALTPEQKAFVTCVSDLEKAKKQALEKAVNNEPDKQVENTDDAGGTGKAPKAEGSAGEESQSGAENGNNKPSAGGNEGAR